MIRLRLAFAFVLLLSVCLFPFSHEAFAQTCTTGEDLDEPTRSALTNTATSYFGMIAHGDSAGLKQNAIPSLASSFDGVDGTVREDQPVFAGVNPAARTPFLLKLDGQAPVDRAEFLCGVFGAKGQTANSAEFIIPNLAPGTYAIAIVDAATSKGPYAVSFVLEKQGVAWKLGGLFVKRTAINGHDAAWFEQHAVAFTAKSQLHNAWFYFFQAREMAVPVSFMSTQFTDKLFDEAQTVKPSDLPDDKTIDLLSGTRTFKVTSIFPLFVGQDFDLVVKYQSADVSNTTQTFQDNTAVMKAVVAKFPEFRDAFDGVVARAVESSGKDYGSLLPMKDIK
jgi:hypothetical protein